MPTSQLYGGKIAAALSRQHPRDFFDIYHSGLPLEELKTGIVYALLGSDRPILESLAPNLLDQRDTMESQFKGMSDMEFSYEMFEATRTNLIEKVNNLFTEEDKKFLISFESGEPDWKATPFETLQEYPSIKWKLLNIGLLKRDNPEKHRKEIGQLRRHFGA